jgi:hypothetical protein
MRRPDLAREGDVFARRTEASRESMSDVSEAALTRDLQTARDASMPGDTFTNP